MERLLKPGRNAVLCLLAALLITTMTMLAFDIAEDRGSHQEITREGLKDVTAMVEGKARTFSRRAVEQINLENAESDSLINRNAAFFKPTWHFTDERFSDSSFRLIAIREVIRDGLTLKTYPSGVWARNYFGTALHTLQDFYSHSNFIELQLSAGLDGINTLLGRQIMPNPDPAARPCDGNPNRLGPNQGGILTSGYYSGYAFNGCYELPFIDGKCWHGSYKDNDNPFTVGGNSVLPGCRGMNKDKLHPWDVRGSHLQAREFAIRATTDYARQVVGEIKDNKQALVSFLDLPSTIVFSLDRSWGKRKTLAATKRFIRNIMARATATADEQPVNFVLISYGISNDPAAGLYRTEINTSDPQAFLTTLENLNSSREYCEPGKTCYIFYPGAIEEGIRQSYDH
ncbi:MAG: hypothetical protein ACKV2V_26135, partial [Blastocatellia bacterium]